ncbi:MAG: T9SS type A sorting domain-containing protein [Calditrichota bacterium]
MNAPYEGLPCSPNPFNDEAVINVRLAHAGQVRLSVYDIRGRRMADLAEGRLMAGEHQIVWMAQALPTGVYLLRLETGPKNVVKKVVLVR